MGPSPVHAQAYDEAACATLRRPISPSGAEAKGENEMTLKTRRRQQAGPEPVDAQHIIAVDFQHMPEDKSDILHGTLDFIVLKTLHAIGPLHGYAIARRIEQVSADQLAINQGTLYPALLKLQQHGWISTKWGASSTGRRVKVYSITRRGERQLTAEAADWQRAAGIVTKFFELSKALK
jgi:transcriptional regulator